MKRIYLLVLVLAVLTDMSACGKEKAATNETPADTIPTTIEAETTVTLHQEPTALAISIEGEPTLLPMAEYETPYYKLSLTKDEWNRSIEPNSLYPTDSWTCCYNEGIRFNVVHLGKIQATDGLKCVREQHSSYNFDEADPLVLSGMDLADSYFLQGRIFSDSENTFAVYGEFPMEAGDGFVPRINAMVDSFQIAQP